jgi:hypothetical protein
MKNFFYHGWLEKDACYYYDPQAGVLKKMLARQLVKLLVVFA